MPPRANITRADIAEAALNVVREKGAEQLNARQIARKLGCSTQPVMYHFKTMAELKQEVYARADRFHAEYLLTMKKQAPHPLLEIGLNYLRFAREEAPLFRFLFQSGFSPQRTLPEMIEADELAPLLSVLQRNLNMDREQTKTVFLTLALFTHGYASLLSNQHLEYDESLVAVHLKQAYEGAVRAAQEKPQ